jgi:hypothetical protein
MKIRKVVFVVTSLALLAWATPGTAEPFALEAPGLCSPVLASDPFDPGSSLQAYCTADCQYGSVSVNCSGTCTAVDQVCNGGSGSGGYVTCNGVTTSRCEECSSLPPCSEYYGQSCSPDGSFAQCESFPGWIAFCDCVGGTWECLE